MVSDKLIGEITFANEGETSHFAKQLAPLLTVGDVLALEGDLGAGKTAFSRALINSLPSLSGGIEREEVPSPTFTLVQIYDRAATQIWHFDLYRLENPEEAYELGIEEAFSDGISLIEWPDKLGFLMPHGRLRVKLGYGIEETSRTLALFGNENWKQKLRPLFAASKAGSSVDGS